MVTMTDVLPKLIVTGADDAITFYCKAMGAVMQARHTEPGGTVVHAELELDGHRIAVAEAVEAWGWLSPKSFGGSPVLLTLESGDPDAIAHRMTEHGAIVVVPIEDRPYGKREGRVRDPFGHLWIISGDLRRG
jgi:uncharacterized glyoxalase superfamily protein PhnB